MRRGALHARRGGFLVALAGVGTALGAMAILTGAMTAVEAAPPDSAATVQATLRIDEPGFEAGLRIRVFHATDLFALPESAGHLFLVCADSAFGEDAFFIPTDLAFEVGEEQVYRVEFEQASDFFGQALGGRLRPGESQLGFVLVPPAVDLERYLLHDPGQVVVRYAHHRAPLQAMAPEEAAWWRRSVEQPLLAAGLNLWWEWAEAISEAPPLSEGDRRFLAERVFPGQGHILDEEGMSAEALRNAILRVGERRLLDSRIVQRVAPRYPLAARQLGAKGLVIVLGYVTGEGEVGDALILASNTVHLLNLAALAAVQEWRFARKRDEDGNPLDGWRLVPIQFRSADRVEESAGAPAEEGYEPARVVKEVEAELPLEARNRRLQGTVVYRIRLDARGKMVEAVLEEGVHPLLDEAALAALERTRFLPARRDGQPVPSELRIPFTFSLEP
jgi:TonB family protein